MKAENVIVLTIEELTLRWEWLIETGFNNLTITEHFPKRGTNKFIVTDLMMEFENEFAVCTDKNNMIIDQYSPIMAFLRERLSSIHILPLGNDLYQERLVFSDDGVILIEKML